MKVVPVIEVTRAADCGDALRVEYTATSDGRSIEAGIITAAHKTDELQRIREREGAYHLWRLQRLASKG